MSTLEKTIGLLETLPDDKIETVYAFVRFIEQADGNGIVPPTSKDVNSESMNGLRVLHSFAGTLPENFDYKRELEEAREEKYGRFD